jgi:hypothetical protein
MVVRFNGRAALSLGFESKAGWQCEDWALRVLKRRPGEMGEGCPVETIEGVLVVKAQGAKNLETAVQELREERIRKFISW